MPALADALLSDTERTRYGRQTQRQAAMFYAAHAALSERNRYAR
jgi:hypothetical protein